MLTPSLLTRVIATLKTAAQLCAQRTKQLQHALILVCYGRHLTLLTQQLEFQSHIFTICNSPLSSTIRSSIAGMKYLITGHQTVCGVKLLDFVSTSPSMFNRPAELASVNLFFKLL
jgi:hypothetical protein